MTNPNNGTTRTTRTNSSRKIFHFAFLRKIVHSAVLVVLLNLINFIGERILFKRYMDSASIYYVLDMFDKITAVLSLVCIIWGLYGVIKAIRSRLYVEPTRVWCSRGAIIRRKKVIPANQLLTVDLRQSPLQKLFKTGTVVVTTIEDDTVKYKDLQLPDHAANAIYWLIENVQ